MSEPFDPTADEIVAGIRQALADRELAIVPGLVRLLAVKDPHRAQAVLDAIEIAQVVRHA